mmetsp:Transcript_30552/g.50759  ORF Transcript_30552/g.50759 Transcript_30552/m.50759 type:complete len:284 (+) Transcript_30552:199-1050(+)
MSELEFEGNTGFYAAVSAFNGGSFDISRSCFLSGETEYVASSDGAGTVVADAESNSVDDGAYTITGAQCTTEDEGRLFVEGGECLSFATSDVCLTQLPDSLPPSSSPSSFPTVFAELESGVPTAVDVEITVSPTQLGATQFPSTLFPSMLNDSQVESLFPSSVELEPTFLPSKPPTFRPDCPEDGDDDDDDDDGKGKGKSSKSTKGCRRKKYKRKRWEKKYDVWQDRRPPQKLVKSAKSSKSKSSKSSKSESSSSSSSDYEKPPRGGYYGDKSYYHQKKYYGH